VVFAIPAIGWWRFDLNPIVAFWAAYIVTRPLGASFADGFSKPTNGGLGWGDGTVSAMPVADRVSASTPVPRARGGHHPVSRPHLPSSPHLPPRAASVPRARRRPLWPGQLTAIAMVPEQVGCAHTARKESPPM